MDLGAVVQVDGSAGCGRRLYSDRGFFLPLAAVGGALVKNRVG